MEEIWIEKVTSGFVSVSLTWKIGWCKAGAKAQPTCVRLFDHLVPQDLQPRWSSPPWKISTKSGRHLDICYWQITDNICLRIWRYTLSGLAPHLLIVFLEANISVHLFFSFLLSMLDALGQPLRLIQKGLIHAGKSFSSPSGETQLLNLCFLPFIPQFHVVSFASPPHTQTLPTSLLAQSLGPIRISDFENNLWILYRISLFIFFHLYFLPTVSQSELESKVAAKTSPCLKLWLRTFQEVLENNWKRYKNKAISRTSDNLFKKRKDLVFKVAKLTVYSVKSFQPVP